MAIQFDISKVAMFRNATIANENTKVNLDGNGGIMSAGLYEGRFTDWRHRTDRQRTSNNEVRTAFLKALGQAFNLQGITEENGAVRFSEQFMDRLQQILGNDVFKRGDFDVGNDGIVKSGRPLTKRRIEAIINKAVMVGKTDFNVDIYMKKLQVIKKEQGIGDMPLDELKTKTGKNLFLLAEKCLNFLKNDIFLGKTVLDKETGKAVMVYGPKEEKKDKSFMRLNPDYMDLLDSGSDPEKHGYSKFQLRAKGGGYVPFDANAKDKLQKELTFNELIHTEKAKIDEEDLGSVERQKRYIASIVQQFAQEMIDIYFEAKESGKLDNFMGFLSGGVGACLEDKGMHLENWRKKNLKANEPIQGEQMTKEEIAELERVADLRDEAFAPPPKTSDLVYGVINSLYKTDETFRDKEDWKDFADIVKEKLRGKTAQIETPVWNDERDQYDFAPLLDIKDNPVERPLTDEDIDEIGRACLKNAIG